MTKITGVSECEDRQIGFNDGMFAERNRWEERVRERIKELKKSKRIPIAYYERIQELEALLDNKSVKERDLEETHKDNIALSMGV